MNIQHSTLNIELRHAKAVNSNKINITFFSFLLFLELLYFDIRNSIVRLFDCSSVRLFVCSIVPAVAG